ncbi:dihydrolipoamide acetyltransferase family protein [Blastococcus sp. SYSU D00820]
MPVIIHMPEVLAGTDEAVLGSWLVQPGDEITVGQPIAEIETDKAVVEYAAEVAGSLAGTLIDVGARVPVGTPIAVLAGAGETTAAALQAAGSADGGQPDAADRTPGEDAAQLDHVAAAPAADAAPPAVDAAPARLFASPLVRRLAAQRGIDLSGVRGTGPHGRIVRRDLERHQTATPAPRAPEPAPAVPAPPAPPAARPAAVAAPAGAGTDVPHTGMRRAIARRLTESKTTIPHFYLRADCRVDALLELRRQVTEATGERISVNDLVVKAVAAAFREVPEANAIWTDEAVRRFDDVDVAVAVAVDDGLLTPVVRAVDKRPLREVSAQIRELAGRARAGRIRQEEIEGGSFSVSNLGMYGTAEFAAIINPPHSGILAVGAAEQRPVVEDGALAVATVMTVTLSADHRVLDGALAARWLAAFTRIVENPLAILV